jgi:inositol 2-dehydrogenase
MKKNTVLNVGVIGLGRLGSQYARYVSTRLPGARLCAACDVQPNVAASIARETGAAKTYTDYRELLADKEVDAVVVMTPTKYHGEVITAAAKAKKAIFCEKPLTLDLDEGALIETTVAKCHAFFQLGFMRRFDKAFAAAWKKIQEGAIGTPIVFKSTSKDKSPPPVEFLRPASSGGLFIDMGIHDFDMARWYMGEVKSVFSAGGALAYPEVGEVGDYDNGITTLNFVNGNLGMVTLSRSGVYGYGIHSEIVGTEGTIQIGYDRETAILMMTKGVIAHDSIPGFYERFEQAYITQLQNFVDNVRLDRPAPIVCKDGIAALRIALAATRSVQSGKLEVVH